MTNCKNDKWRNNDLKNNTHETKDPITRTPLKTGGELRCKETNKWRWSTRIIFHYL